MTISPHCSRQSGLRSMLRSWLLLALCTLAATGHAQLSNVNTLQVITPHVRASLISEQASIAPGQSFWVALHFDIIEGWHTYWQNAGDSGNQPKIQWTLPAGFSASDIQWPYPHRLPVGPLMNYGYSQEAWLLVRITAPDRLAADQDITLRADAEWLVCQEECIPEEGQFSLSMPVVRAGQQQASPWAKRFATIRQQLPQVSPWPSRVSVGPKELQLTLDIAGMEPARLQEVYFFPASYGVVEHAARQPFTLTEQGLELQLVRGDLRAQPLQQLHGVLVLSERLPDGIITRAFTINAAATAAPTSAHSLLLILFFALLGGLLLNIMPCVFPILSLKALSIVQSAARAPNTVRRNGYAFTAGVLVCFGLIAFILLLLRAGGEAIGWGFQLQSPVFVLLLTWLLFAMGLMFSGVWSFGERWMGVGQQLTTRSGNLGAFFTGVLAVIVATPCTAPFMGTALGYALSQPAWVAVSIFMLLGLGMALPWLLISLWPGLSGWLPKPGPWMERVKQMLAFPLYATAAWLLWVFAQQADQQSLLYALLSLVLIALVLWLWQITRTASKAWHTTMLIATLGLSILLTGLLLNLAPSATSAGSVAHNWERYDATRLSQLRREGKPVLVNFTAAWCITCLVNEKVALNTHNVQTQLREKAVVYMKGDWTNKDPTITNVLLQHGRSGVPLYLLFPRDPQAEAIVLPNILTEGMIVDALQKLD